MKLHTEHTYRRRIAAVIEAIIVDPSAPHTTEDLAAIAHFSPYHFHRLYRAFTGENAATTVRRARLAMAARRLAGGAGTVADTAFEAGYDSPQSFARAFRSLTGLTPSDFQQQQQTLTSAALAVTIVERPAATALCLRHDGPVATIPHTYRRLAQAAHARGLDPDAMASIGIGYGDPEQADGFQYLAGFLPPDGFDGDGDAHGALERHAVSGGRYAVHRLTGSYALIAPTLQTVFGAWLPQSGMEPDDRPVLELYIGAAQPGPPVTDLLIPVREVTP